MAILATQSFDGLSESETINTAALGAPWSVFAANTNPVAQASAANHGARGAYIAPASGAVRVQWEEAQSSATRVLSWYFRLLVDGGANTYFSSLSDGVTGRGDWRINADRTVTLTIANFNAVDEARLTDNVQFVSGTLSALDASTAQGGKAVHYRACGTSPNFTGAAVSYWSYSTAAAVTLTTGTGC